MHGQKMDESVKTAIFLARVLERFGIPFAIKYFGSQVKSIMEFGDDYDDAKKKIKPRLLREGNASDGSTDMGTPITQAVGDLTQGRRKYAGCHGAIFVISDSGANAGTLVGPALAEYIQEQQKSFTIINFLLSGNASEIADAKALFGELNTIIASDFSKLPEAAFQGLRIVMERVLRTFRSIG